VCRFYGGEKKGSQKNVYSTGGKKKGRKGFANIVLSGSRGERASTSEGGGEEYGMPDKRKHTALYIEKRGGPEQYPGEGKKKERPLLGEHLPGGTQHQGKEGGGAEQHHGNKGKTSSCDNQKGNQSLTKRRGEKWAKTLISNGRGGKKEGKWKIPSPNYLNWEESNE